VADRPIIDPGENPYLYGQSIPMVPPAQPPITQMLRRLMPSSLQAFAFVSPDLISCQ